MHFFYFTHFMLSIAAYQTKIIYIKQYSCFFWICNWGRVQQGRLVSAPCSLSQLGQLQGGEEVEIHLEDSTLIFLLARWCTCLLLSQGSLHGVAGFSRTSVSKDKVEVASFYKPGLRQWCCAISSAFYWPKAERSHSCQLSMWGMLKNLGAMWQIPHTL